MYLNTAHHCPQLMSLSTGSKYLALPDIVKCMQLAPYSTKWAEPTTDIGGASVLNTIPVQQTASCEATLR